MTWTKEQHAARLPVVAASTIVPYVPVKDTSTKDVVTLAAAVTDRPVAVTTASAAQGEALQAARKGVVTCLAAASLGANAAVGVASTNGALGLVTAASGIERFEIGVTKHAAAAGEVVAVDLSFRSVQTGGG